MMRMVIVMMGMLMRIVMMMVRMVMGIMLRLADFIMGAGVFFFQEIIIDSTSVTDFERVRLCFSLACV